MNYYFVAVKALLPQPLIYQSSFHFKPGQIVNVPLSSRKVKGLILSQTQKPSFKTRSIDQKDLDDFSLEIAYLRWIQWVARYYCYPLGMAAGLCYPPPPPKRIKVKEKIPPPSPPSFSLNKEQMKCYQDIQKTNIFKVHLLYGVTGSGKTEVYLKLIEEQLKKQKSSLILVPEISLTPQLFLRFDQRFPGQVGMIHSGIRSNQRYMDWKALFTGEKKILLGARSAVFCPINSLSLIIVDEEHETHFKQDEGLKYHGRDAAMMLAKIKNIPIVLGSATPSLETYLKAKSGQYDLHVLKNRFKNYPMPRVEIVDLKKEPQENKKKDLPFWLSSSLFKAICQSLKKKEQVALFLNRRGQSSISLCEKCGQSQMCRHCDISLTLHSDQYLVCHYCDFSIEVLRMKCSFCQGDEFVHLGIGTEEIYSKIKKLFPKAKVALADSDHVSTNKQFKNLLEDMISHKIDILIGTQMIAKGLDIPRLNLAGLILVDLSLYNQDFRSSERCFQLITQMIGRSGRHQLHSSRAIIQTYNPDHFAIQCGAEMNFEKMAHKELSHRKKLNYPPYNRLALIRISSAQISLAQKTSWWLFEKLKKYLDQKGFFEILGPAKAPIFKLRSKYRYHILMKSSTPEKLHQACSYLLTLSTKDSKVTIQVNKDPVFF